MGRDNMRDIRGYIVKHCKIVFPVILIVVVAVTVSVALGANRRRMEESSAAGDGSTADAHRCSPGGCAACGE